MFSKNSQGFTIINLSQNPVKFGQQIDAVFQFDFHGYEISVSTGGSVLSGACLVEHLVTRPDTSTFVVRGSVEDAIMQVLAEVNSTKEV